MDAIDYWFYLEPYSFIFKGDNKFIIYNTLNSEYIDCSLFDSVQNIIEELFSSNKNYCVGLNKKQLRDRSFHEFLKKIICSFSGGIVENKGHSPFIFKPVLKIYYHPAKSSVKEERLLGINTLLYLHEVSFFFENKENVNEHIDFYKQFLYPKQTNSQKLTTRHYQTIIEQLAICNIDKINVIAGSSVNNMLFTELLDMIHQYHLKTDVIIPYKDYLHTDVSQFFNNPKLTLKVLIHFPIDIDNLENLMNSSKNSKIIWCMILSGEEDIESFEKITYSSDINVEFLPWYNGNNMNFFRKYVFNTFDDIIGPPVSKKRIFRRQVLNENFFGKLFIFPDGNVYANTNFPSIGNLLDQKLTKIVHNEICNPSNAWFMTRDNSSDNCKHCFNRYLCPSISNYEIVTGIHNMCYLNIINQ